MLPLRAWAYIWETSQSSAGPTRLATRCIDFLIEQIENDSTNSAFIGLHGREIKFHSLEDFDRLANLKTQRPKEQWWLDIRPIAKVLAQPCASCDMNA